MRILFVTPTSPFDISFGGGQRSAHLYKALQEHGDVDVLMLEEGKTFSSKQGVRPEEIARMTFSESTGLQKYKPCPNVRAWVSSRLNLKQYDLIVGRTLAPISKLGKIGSVPRIVDLDDGYYRYAPRTESLLSRGASMAKTYARAFATSRTLREFEYVWLASEADVRRFPVQAGCVLPNIYAGPLPEVQAPVSGTQSILFVGSLWYGPNRHAANWFMSVCWPKIIERVPSAKLRLVGACAESERAQWNKSPGVTAPGFVPDLAAEYRAASFTISPIQYGGGTQIKVLESFAHGRAAIVSRFIHERYSRAFEAGVSLVVAASANETVDECVALLRDTKRAERIAEAGRRTVESKFNFYEFRDAVANGIGYSRRT